jgi:hypothetical protein
MIHAVYWENLGFTPEDQLYYAQVFYGVPHSLPANVGIVPSI